jgi:hypothetical protein
MIQLLIEQLKVLSKVETKFTFGELLYTVLRPKYVKNPNTNLKFLLDIPDNDFMTALEKAISDSKKIQQIKD